MTGMDEVAHFGRRLWLFEQRFAHAAVAGWSEDVLREREQAAAPLVMAQIAASVAGEVCVRRRVADGDAADGEWAVSRRVAMDGGCVDEAVAAVTGDADRA